jgi:hypothetical protein
MTIQGWNLLFNAGIFALMLVGGLWLKYIVDQQLKAKDAAMKVLESTIKGNEAEISALRSNTAPAIAQAYAVMKQHAEDVTGEALRLAEQVRKLSEEVQDTENLTRLDMLLGETTGLLVALKAFKENLEQSPSPLLLAQEPQRMLAFINGCNTALEQVAMGVRDRSKEIRDTVRAQTGTARSAD